MLTTAKLRSHQTSPGQKFLGFLKSPLILGRQSWLTALIWMLVVLPAQAALELRVAIQEGASQVKVGSSTPAIVRDSAGKPLGQIAAMDAFNAQLSGGIVRLERWQSRRLWVEPFPGRICLYWRSLVSRTNLTAANGWGLRCH
ncbi:hypothetical protein [Neosynechococcus sphagnicola]|uniref:hypothetical protein n=1 Tax=Neosynechococcus sphagnicola TaxID=1501145 RepID=UPI001EF9D625|nr:hypothetical protein [Neosynechococcus sphagnicola]